MFCKNCGHKILEDADVCLNCGYKVEEKPFVSKTGLGVLACLFLSFIGLIIGLCVYPKNSYERATFEYGFWNTFIILAILVLIVLVIFIVYPPARILILSFLLFV